MWTRSCSYRWLSSSNCFVGRCEKNRIIERRSRSIKSSKQRKRCNRPAEWGMCCKWIWDTNHTKELSRAKANTRELKKFPNLCLGLRWIASDWFRSSRTKGEKTIIWVRFFQRNARKAYKQIFWWVENASLVSSCAVYWTNFIDAWWTYKSFRFKCSYLVRQLSSKLEENASSSVSRPIVSGQCMHRYHSFRSGEFSSNTSSNIAITSVTLLDFITM